MYNATYYCSSNRLGGLSFFIKFNSPSACGPRILLCTPFRRLFRLPATTVLTLRGAAPCSLCLACCTLLWAAWFLFSCHSCSPYSHSATDPRPKSTANNMSIDLGARTEICIADRSKSKIIRNQTCSEREPERALMAAGWQGEQTSEDETNCERPCCFFGATGVCATFHFLPASLRHLILLVIIAGL